MHQLIATHLSNFKISHVSDAIALNLVMNATLPMTHESSNKKMVIFKSKLKSNIFIVQYMRRVGLID